MLIKVFFHVFLKKRGKFAAVHLIQGDRHYGIINSLPAFVFRKKLKKWNPLVLN